MIISLRSATSEDDAFLLQVYSSTRAEEMALTDWNKSQREAFLRMQCDAQRSHYQQHYPEAEYQVILLDEQPSGRLYVARKQSEIRILDLTLLPEFRNRGAGTSILNDLMAEASESGKPLTVYVESFNRSLRLFERRGFSKIGEHGANYLMEWRESK